MRVLVLGIILVVLVIIIPMSFSKYEQEAVSNVNSSVAYYVLDTNYQYIDVRIPNMVPREAPYIYNFSVSNFKDQKRAEVNMEYNLTIKTTTNLELRYELVLNEDYHNGTNIITSSNIIKDTDGTYFKELKTSPQYFDFHYNETNNYTLLIYFNDVTKSYKYQDIIESIFIIIDSKQLT